MLSQKLLLELQEYVDKHLNILEFTVSNSMSLDKFISEEIHIDDIEEFVNKMKKPTFNQALFNYIDKKRLKDSDVYKKSGIDRRHFSKIRSNPDYRPKKTTAIALALALELNKRETTKLLSSAGYTLSDSETFDLVIQFCLEKKIYDFDQVNQALDYFSLKPLIGVVL